VARVDPSHYDTLLRVRQRQEDLRAQALAVALRDVRAAERERAELAERQRQALAAAGVHARDRFNPDQVRLYYQYERHLARRIDEKDASIHAFRGVAERRREELDEAMKRRRIIEKLKERLERAYAAHRVKQEQTLSDEVATNYAAFARGRGRGNQSP